jgi:hypothetical protein
LDIKLIVTDLDRTLLHTDKTLSPYTVKALNRCRQKGIKLAFATARNKHSLERFTQLLDVPPDALIARNGTEVYINNMLHTCCGIDPILRDNLLLALSDAFPEATLSVEIDGSLYGNANLFKKWNDPKNILSDFTDLSDRPAAVIIVGVSCMADIERLTPYIPNGLYIEMSSGENQHLGFIMNRKATKWAGVQTISQQLCIPVANIIAFGDDYNDISMLENCGTGIAVANAIAEAKAVATHICDSNNNDGVAKWLNDYMDIQDEIARYKTLPCEFNGFITVPTLSDGEIFLVCVQKYTNPEKKHVPAYDFAICKGGEKIGSINLRIGYGGGPFGQNLYYGGQIGYDINEAHRGNNYAVRACRLLIPVAQAHKIHTLLITNDQSNHASIRVCEKLGAKLIRTAPLPEWHDLYKEGQRFSNIYEWRI